MLIVYLTTINHRITICFFLVKPSRKGSSHEASVVEGELPSYLHSYHLVWGPRSVPWYLWVSSKKSADGLVFHTPKWNFLFFFKCFILFSWGVCSDLYRVCLCFKAIYGCFIGFSRDFSVLQSVTVFSDLWWFMMILSYYIYDITLTSAVGIDGGDIFEPRPPLARPFHFSRKWITWQLCVR